VKIDSTGNVIWKKVIGGSDWDESHSIVKTTDGGFLLTGQTYSNNFDFNAMNKGLNDIIVIKFDSLGVVVWKKTFGGTGYESGLSITSSVDNIFVTGTTFSKDGEFTGLKKGISSIFILKLDINGELLFKKTYGGSNDNTGASINSTHDGIFLTGWTNSNDGDFVGMNKGNFDCLVMKLDLEGNLKKSTVINEFSESSTTLSVHPNPFSNTTTISYKVETPSNISIELLNTLGQTIEVLRNDYSDSGTYQLPLNVSTLSSGMYSVRMRSGSMNEVVPVCVVK
jgi:hypothetical protein